MNEKRIEIKGRAFLVRQDGRIFREAFVSVGGKKYKGKEVAQSLDTAGYYNFSFRDLGGDMHTRNVHRVIAQAFLGFIGREIQVDHINGIKTDNRVENLRLTSPEYNKRAYNRARKGTSSRYRGVSFNKRRSRWVAYIRENGKLSEIGAYDSEYSAATARDMEAVRRGWPKEGLNFPHLAETEVCY